MKQINDWNGQIENTTLEYDVTATESASEKTESLATKAALICEYDKPDRTDYIIAASSGLLTGIIDSFWVGEFSLSKAQDWGRSKANSFVLRVAQLRGYEKTDLGGAIKYLEKDAPMVSDQLTNVWGGGLQHHFRDFAHHASVVGLIFSILTQFTGLSYGTNTQGQFEIHDLPDKTLIGTNFEEKLYYGIVMWFLHLVSDMAGSSSNAGKGTGIPGPMLSLAKGLSVLPGIRNIEVNYKEDSISLSVMLSKLFNGTAFEHTSYKDLKRFDLRTELGVYGYGTKQGIPVVINQCVIRAYYFVRRFCVEISEKEVHSISELKKLDPSHFLPFNNKCILRMATISSGVFCAVDASDAAIRAFLSGADSKAEFVSKLLLRTNFVGIGNFVISIKNDIASSVFGNKPVSAVEVAESKETPLSFDSIVIDVSVDVDSTGIYDYCFYRMLKHVKENKEKFSASLAVSRGMEEPILKLEDDETKLFDIVARISRHSLIVETENLMMRLLTFYGIGYYPFTGYEKYDYYAPFYRVENGKRIAYVFTDSITHTPDWSKIKKECNVDGIKSVAMVELGDDSETRNTIIKIEDQKAGDNIERITLQDLFSLISISEYSTYKSYVNKYNEDIRRLIGYRTIVIPSDSSLEAMRKDIEAELRKTDFISLLRREGLHNDQIQIINSNFWKRDLYKAMIGRSAFAESFISSEWYYQTHTVSTALEQTAIVAGYLKSVEQLLYTLVQFSSGTGKSIKRKGNGRAEFVEYCEENRDVIDTTLGSIIGYARHYSELWAVNSYVKNYIADKLDVFREQYRNDHFHKDNINDPAEIKEIRTNTILLHFLLLGAMRISDSQFELLGITPSSVEDIVLYGIDYKDLEQWLDRILGGDVLLSPESNIYLEVAVWGTKQWRLEFSTVSGFSPEGFPENMEWPYIGDDFKWNRCNEDNDEAERQAIDMVQRYLIEGKYSGNLKVYKSVSVGWFGKHTVLYQR